MLTRFLNTKSTLLVSRKTKRAHIAVSPKEITDSSDRRMASQPYYESPYSPGHLTIYM